MRTVEAACETKDFPLDDGLHLPQDSVHRVVDGDHHLFTSEKCASYIVTSALGAQFVELLNGGGTLREVLTTMTKELGLTEEGVSKILSQVLLQVEKNGFYGDAELVEDVADYFPMLCYLTRLCNLKCSHCYMSAGPDVPTAGDLPADVWVQVFSDYRALLEEHPDVAGKITFSGGEALTRRDFFDLAEAARRLEVHLELFTNGTLIRDKNLAARLAENFNSIQVSLDGATRDVNDAIRGRGVHERVVRALRLLTEAGLQVRLAVTLMPANMVDIKDHLAGILAEFESGRIEVRIGLANVQGRADPSVRFANSVEGEESLRKVLSSLEERGLKPPRKITGNLRAVTCGYGRTLNIGSDGTVYACAIEAFPLGNVRNRPLEEIGRRVFEFSRATEVDNIPGCDTCDLRYLCNGGCRLVNLSRNGDLRIPSCTPQKREELLRRLVRRELAGTMSLASRSGVGAFWF